MYRINHFLKSDSYISIRIIQKSEARKITFIQTIQKSGFRKTAAIRVIPKIKNQVPCKATTLMEQPHLSLRLPRLQNSTNEIVLKGPHVTTIDVVSCRIHPIRRSTPLMSSLQACYLITMYASTSECVDHFGAMAGGIFN